ADGRAAAVHVLRRRTPVGPAATERRSSRGYSVTRRPLFWTAAMAAVFLMAAAAVFTRSLNHDAAWYLYMADALRGGSVLYRDVADTNPPLIVFLSLPPIWLAALFHLSQA